MTKFSRPLDLVQGIFAPLDIIMH